MLAACVPQSAYEKQGMELQQARAQAAAQQAVIAKMQQEQKWVVAGDLLFPEGDYQLSANGKQALNQYVPKLQNLQNAKVVVYGYTDNLPVGPALHSAGVADTIDLSARRADSVVSYFTSQGVNPNIISAKGFGEVNPVASNDTPQGRALNRRIEIIVTGGQSVGTAGGAWLGGLIGAGLGAVAGGVIGYAVTPPILASRLFAGPTQYPPNDFAAYGIVAFKTRATPDDNPRYEMICDAYVAGLLHFTDVKVPLKKQMVTVWPIESDGQATRINKMTRESLCPEAVRHYGLPISLEAIESARRSNVRFDDAGPFLLAWSPSETKGQPDALVLVSDLSDVTNSEQAKQIFFDWFSKIQENPELWRPGWDIAKLKVTIRLWADKYGEKLLRVVGLKD
jgi:outer membrane protein OmpA-like peptidoglycan-associated protein